jgi:site-specific DNA-cytosine methylase
MRVLVACEFSGRVRDAFIARGHEAVSCDLLPSEAPGPHIIGDVRRQLKRGRWDLMVAFPPCTHLAASGARWWAAKRRSGEQQEAIAFVEELLAAPVPRIALENPVGILSKAVRPPDQVIQPWQHGHGETKKTCLWLVNLPHLKPSRVVEVSFQRPYYAGVSTCPGSWASPSPDRWKQRSRTYPGIAKAMAKQWGEIR